MGKVWQGRGVKQFALQMCEVKSGGPIQSFSLPLLQLLLFLDYWQCNQLQSFNRRGKPGLLELQTAHS